MKQTSTRIVQACIVSLFLIGTTSTWSYHCKIKHLRSTVDSTQTSGYSTTEDSISEYPNVSSLKKCTDKCKKDSDGTVGVMNYFRDAYKFSNNPTYVCCNDKNFDTGCMK